MRAGIVGVGGYTGLELVKILLNHPKFDLVYTAATSQNQLNTIFPMLKGICDMQVEIADPNEIKKKVRYCISRTSAHSRYGICQRINRLS